MITVTAATGELGSQIVTSLLETVPATDISATVRSAEKAAALADQGITVHQASYDDVDTMAQALGATETLMFVSGDAPVTLRTVQHRNVIDAAVKAGVQRIVYTSFLDARADSPFTFSAIHADTEAYLQASGLEWTILRPSGYADLNVATAQRALASGTLADATGGAAVSYITRADIARAAAATLTGSTHAGQTYPLTGPAAVTQPEMAALLTQISGTQVDIVDVTFEQYGGALTEAGLPEFMVEALVGLQQAVTEGAMAPVTDDVETLTGRPATSLEAFLRASLTA